MDRVKARWWHFLAALALAFLVTSCASPRANWDARIGNHSYDQVVLDLGPPDKAADLKDGTKVAEWLTQRGYSSSYHSVRGPLMHHHMISPAPNYYLRLIFSPDGILTDYERIVR